MTWLRSVVWRSAIAIALLPICLALVGVLVAQHQLANRLMTQAETSLTAELRNFEALGEQRRVIAVARRWSFAACAMRMRADLPVAAARWHVVSGNITDWPGEVLRSEEGFADGAINP